MTGKRPYPAYIEALDLSGITKVALLGIGDPSVLPLWFGESDLVTPKFIRDAATAALEAGKTFYIHARGILALREGAGRLSQADQRRRCRGGTHHRAGSGDAGDHLRPAMPWWRPATMW